MNIERYEFQRDNTYTQYGFVSDGPKNKIIKSVSYSPFNMEGVTFFNLGFGDMDRTTGAVSDMVVSDNKDTDKVLATLAAIVLDFTARFPDIPVYVKGSTPSRTRRYQMGIAAYWHDIEPVLDIYGSKDNVWHPFTKGVNYDAFFAKRK